MSTSINASGAGTGSRLGRRLLLYLALVLVMGNFVPLFEKIHHPKMSYLEPEHLVTGAVTALMVAVLLVFLEVYLTKRRQAEEALRRLHVTLEEEVRARTAELERANARLNKVRSQQQALLDSIPDLAWLKDKESRFIAVNRPFGEACGVDPGDLVGKTDLDIWPPDLAEAYRADDRKVVETGAMRRIEEPLVDSYGNRTWIETIKVPILGEAAEIVGTAGIARDVTKRRRIEEALRASEAEYRILSDEFKTLLDAIPDMVYFKDAQGRHRFVNRSFEEAVGIRRDEVAGKTAEDLLPPETAAACRRSDQAVMEARSTTRCEETEVRPDGTVRSFESTKAPIFGEGGEVVGLVGVTRDITKRKRAEEELAAYRERLEQMVGERTVALMEANRQLRQEIASRSLAEEALKASEFKYRSLVERIPCIIYKAALDKEGSTLYISPQVETLLGYPRDEWTKDPYLWGKCIHPEDRKRVLAEWKRDAMNGKPVPQEYRVTGRDGRVVWFRDDATLIRDESGNPLFIQGVLSDITRLKEMERVALVQEKMATLGHMAAGIAHEIRNPLSGLNMLLSSLERTAEESLSLSAGEKDTLMHVMEQAKTASQKIEGVIRRVMDLVSPAPSRKALVSLDACIRETIQLAEAVLRREKVVITKALADGLPECHADPRLLEQVLLNLITNAVQAMDGAGGSHRKRIEISSGLEDGHVVIRVADSGPGVPPELREHIFEPFFTTKNEGTGIGLAFSRKVVTDHRGTLTVGESALGGAEFRVGIPVGEKRRGRDR